MIDRLFGWLTKDSRILVRNGQSIIDNNKFYGIRLATPNPETKTSSVIDKNTNVTDFPDLSGDNDVTISLDWIQDIVDGIDSWESMDVYARCQQVTDRAENVGEAILVSVNNPTIGEPYCIVQTTDGFYFKHAFDENKGVDVMLKDGRCVRVYRDSDTDLKEWKIDVDT